MKRKEARPIRKVTLNLFDGDFTKLQEFYPVIGAGKVIRLLVSNHIKEMEARQQNLPTPKLEITLDDE